MSSERTERLKAELEKISHAQETADREIARKTAENAEVEQFIRGQMTALIGQIGISNEQSNARIGDQLQGLNEKTTQMEHHIAELQKHLKDTTAIDDIYQLKKEECNRALAEHKAECDRQLSVYRAEMGERRSVLLQQEQKIQKSLDNLKKRRKNIVILFIVLTLVCMIGGAILGYKGISLLGF